MTWKELLRHLSPTSGYISIPSQVKLCKIPWRGASPHFLGPTSEYIRGENHILWDLRCHNVRDKVSSASPKSQWFAKSPIHKPYPIHLEEDNTLFFCSLLFMVVIISLLAFYLCNKWFFIKSCYLYFIDLISLGCTMIFLENEWAFGPDNV